MKAFETLPADLPELSLGWGVAGWMQRWLQCPSDPDRKLSLTDEQLRFLVHWYAVTGEGRWVYRRGIMRRPKGAGKDPLCAMVSFAEMVGPTVFDGFAADGSPTGRQWQKPLVQVAAVAMEQTRTTTGMLDALAGPEFVARYRIRIGERRTTGRVAQNRLAEIRPVTSSARTVEGARTTAMISNESHHWVEANGGHKMSAVVRRNLAKSAGGAARELSITNAHEVGEDSIAERDHDSWTEQHGRGDILMDSREPVLDDGFDLADDDQLRAAISVAYGDAWWIDTDRIVAECRDPDISPGHIHRFYLNRLVAGSARWMDPSCWDYAYDPDRMPDPDMGISLGFDGSRTFDSTAIVATCMETGWQWLAGIWEHDPAIKDWEVPVYDVWGTVERLFDTWRVARMYCDPAYWDPQISRWEGRWEEVAVWDFSATRQVKTARATAAYRSAVARREVTWGGPASDAFRRHVLNGVERVLQGVHGEDGRLHTVGKETRHSPRSVDAAHAAILSWQARLDAVADGWRLPRKISMFTPQ